MTNGVRGGRALVQERPPARGAGRPAALDVQAEQAGEREVDLLRPRRGRGRRRGRAAPRSRPRAAGWRSPAPGPPRPRGRARRRARPPWSRPRRGEAWRRQDMCVDSCRPRRSACGIACRPVADGAGGRRSIEWAHVRHRRLRRATSRLRTSSSRGCGASSTAATTRPGSRWSPTAARSPAQQEGRQARQPREGDRRRRRCRRRTPASATPAGPPTARRTTSTPTRTSGHGRRVALVHNGIIENFAELRAALEADGHELRLRDRHRGRRPPARARRSSPAST